MTVDQALTRTKRSAVTPLQAAGLFFFRTAIVQAGFANLLDVQCETSKQGYERRSRARTKPDRAMRVMSK